MKAMGIIRKIKYIVRGRLVSNSISRISAYKDIEGWLTDGEAYGLFKTAQKVKKDGLVVEIGSWKGKSTYCIARGLRKGKVIAIDPFNAEGEEGSKELYIQTRGDKPLLDQFKDRMRQNGVLDKILPSVGYSSQFVDKIKQIDFLFIDGDHSVEGCDYDYLNYSGKIIKGGFLAFHDFDPGRDDLGPTWVIKNRVMKTNGFKFIYQYDSLWVARKV